MNCTGNPADGQLPCGECENCKAIKEGRFLDVIEMDAASNNGVDDIRDLIDRVNYPPMVGRYKVYIIDEVHMLSTSAENAFLKTLEEPPAHVIFILATTNPEKVRETSVPGACGWISAGCPRMTSLKAWNESAGENR